jgi:hypothetical protein
VGGASRAAGEQRAGTKALGDAARARRRMHVRRGRCGRLRCGFPGRRSLLEQLSLLGRLGAHGPIGEVGRTARWRSRGRFSRLA